MPVITDHLLENDGMLIRAYGEYWSRSAVDWQVSKPKLAGKRRHYKKTGKGILSKTKECDAWNQRGIYAFYANFKLVYVGMAGSAEGIGTRLQSHATKPRLTGRWDSFSWFGINGFDAAGKPREYEAKPISADALVRSLELVSILVADPKLNRSQGRFKGAEQIDQDPLDRASTELELLREILEFVKRK